MNKDIPVVFEEGADYEDGQLVTHNLGTDGEELLVTMRWSATYDKGSISDNPPQVTYRVIFI